MIHYIGKDRVTQGSMLILDRREAFRLLRSRAKQGIRKAQRALVSMEESRDLSLMAKVWYDAATLPKTLQNEQRMFVARIHGELVGAIIVTPVSPNTLFYHYGGTTELGRQHEINAYMFWHIVEIFEGTQYRFLDVGVSFRHELQHYFQKYCTHPYPILFRPPDPEILPHISMHPFHTGHLHWDPSPTNPINTALLEFLGAEFTYLPAAEYAILAGVKSLGVQPGELIGVVSSLPESAPAPIIQKALDGYCPWTQDMNQDIKALLVNHRFGIPYQQIEHAMNRGVPILEVSLDSLNTMIGEQRVGTFGDSAVFDFTRIFPMQFGAALVGAYFDDRKVWDNFGCLDVDKRNEIREQLGVYWNQLPAFNQRRRELWQEYEKLFRQAGMEPIKCQSERSEAIPQSLDDNIVPSAFVFHALPAYPPRAIQERLAKFGITVEIDENENWVALPCHQFITPNHRDYIFGAYRGMMNPCVDYVRPPSTIVV
jgi:hypothetical protein